MPEINIELAYELSRKQRLIPHIRMWGAHQCFVFLSIVGVIIAASHVPWWMIVTATLLFLFLWRGYFIGILNALFVRSQHMDIRIEEYGLGYMVGVERLYIFLDGLKAVRDLESTVWTIQHGNGTVVNIPKNIHSSEALEFTRNRVHRANEIRHTCGIQNPFP